MGPPPRRQIVEPDNGKRRQLTLAGSAIFDDQAWEQIAGSLKFSPRELQLARGVFDNHTDGAIASNLGISPHTVHTYFGRLYRKLGVSDRVQLILRVTNQFLALRASSENGPAPISPSH